MSKVYPFAVNYRSSSGVFAPINAQLQRSGSGYAQRANNLGVSLPSSASGLAHVADASGSLAFGLAGASGSGSVSGVVEKFATSQASTGLEYASLSGGIGWQATTPATQTTISWTVHPSAGLSVRLVRSGVAFVTKQGRVVWEFAAPSAHVSGSRQPVPTQITVKHHDGAVVITVAIAHGAPTPKSAAGKRGFASFDRSATAVAIPAALVNPSPIVWGGQVVQGVALGFETATGDCYLDSASPNTSFCVSGTNYVGPADHTLLNFDITDSVPSHAQVLQAFVSMTLESESSTTAEKIGVWQAGTPWTNFATWNTSDGATNWTTAGGDITGAEQDNNNIGTSGDLGSAFFWNVNSIVQGWVDGNPAQTDGLYFAAEAGGSAPNKLGFYTETAAPTNNPYMEVYYEPRMGDYPSAPYATQHLTDRSSLSVNEGTGNLYLTNNDVHLAGVNGLDLNIGRSYNGASTDQDSFGVGWSMGAGADSYLAVPCDNASTVAYFDGTGNAQTFYTDDVTGQPVNPPGVDARLTMNVSGDPFSSSTFTLLFRHSGITETFTKSANSCQQVAQLQTIKNRNNDTITYHYTSGKLTTITDSYGNTTTISYTSGYVSEIADPTGRDSYYWQNASGELTKYEDPAGNYTNYTYDAKGNLTQIQTPQGNFIKIHYDTASTNEVNAVTRYVQPTDTSGPKTTYQYAVASGTCTADPGWTQATVKDPDGHVSTVCSDDLSRNTGGVDANGNTRATCYDPTANPDGFPTATVSPLGTLTTMTYSMDGKDNVDTIKQGGTSTSSCNGSGGNSDPGLTTTLAYTDTNNPYLANSITDPQTQITSYGHDATTGNLTSVTNGAISSSLTYDPTAGINYGTLATSVDPKGATTTYTPSSGNIVTVTPPTGSGLNTIHLSYDTANRLKEVSSVSGTSGHEVDYTYDALDREHTAIYKNAAGTTIATITYTYDADGNLTQRNDSAGNTTYTYDGLDRLTEVAYPDGTWTKYGYDAAGNMTTLQDAGGTVTYKYDKANQLTSVTNPSASKAEATMTYDKNGNLTKTAYASGASISYAYNGEDQLSYQTDTYKTATGTIAKLSWGSKTTPITYSGTLVASVLDQSGNTTNYTYDGLNRLTEAKTTNGATTVADYQYTLDAAGNPTKTVLNGTTTSYAYRAGNETCWSYTGTSTNACGSPPSGANSYTYDADGNQTANGSGLTATYNALGQTTAVGSTSYTYLGEGQDELITDGSTTLHNDSLGLASTNNGSTHNYYTRNTNGTEIDERTSAGTYDYLYDDTGNVIGLLDSTGHLINQYTYDPYGNKTTVTSTAANPFAFQNRYQLSSGLLHFGARYLNPTDTRWTQPDPLNQTSSLAQANRYAFAADDPINASDPTGDNVGTTLKGVACALVISCGVTGSGVETRFGGFEGSLPTPVTKTEAELGGDIEDIGKSLFDDIEPDLG